MSPRFIPGEAARVVHERWLTEHMTRTGEPITTGSVHDRFGIRTLVARGLIRAGTALSRPGDPVVGC